MKIVFMGTPDFAAKVLEDIIKAGHEVGYAITQPDRAKNRGKKILFTPVKEVALKHNIKVLQPERIKKSPEEVSKVKEYNPDIIVVAAYGQLIQKKLLELPKYGCINVHASLLPKLRGASPIQHAILNGEEKTGVTIMQMAEGMDTGDMLTKAETFVGEKNYKELHDELAVLGGKLLVETLPLIEEGKIKPEAQDEKQATYAKLIFKDDGKIDFRQAPENICRQIRGFDPWPGAYCEFNELTMKIWKGEVLTDKSEEEAGTVLKADKDGIDVVCGSGILRIKEIQLPGKKRVSVDAYLRGNSIEKGTILK